MKIYIYKELTALSLAALMAAGSAATVLADVPAPAPGQAYTEAMARLRDNHMEYDELTDLVKNGYGPIKSAYDMAENMDEDQGSIAAAMRVVADDTMSQADMLADTLGSGNPAVMQVVGGARALRSNASAMDRRIDRSSTSSKKRTDRGANSVIFNVEMLMNQYEAMQSQRTVLAKAMEVAQAAQTIQQTMQAQGLAVDADVLSAASQLAGTKSQLESLDAGLEQIYKSLCLFTGWDKAPEDTVIGPVPAADPSVIASIDLKGDTEKAVNNNYELIAMRSGSGAGMTDFQVRTTKGMTQKANKMRTVDYSEDQMRSDMQVLYDTILEKKVAYDSAATAYQSAQLTWNAAQIQGQNGSLSQIQYMQQELAYLQAQSGFRSADLNLQQALRNYQWAVKGVSVSVG